MAIRTVAQIEAELKAAKEKEECEKRDKRYIEASKMTLFIIIGIVIFAFFIASFLAFITNDTGAATNNLQILTNWSQYVLIAIIAKSGFENISKGRTRDRIIKSKIDNNENITIGVEDFRESV